MVSVFHHFTDFTYFQQEPLMSVENGVSSLTVDQVLQNVINGQAQYNQIVQTLQQQQHNNTYSQEQSGMRLSFISLTISSCD